MCMFGHICFCNMCTHLQFFLHSTKIEIQIHFPVHCNACCLETDRKHRTQNTGMHAADKMWWNKNTNTNTNTITKHFQVHWDACCCCVGNWASSAAGSSHHHSRTDPDHDHDDHDDTFELGLSAINNMNGFLLRYEKTKEFSTIPPFSEHWFLRISKASW